MGQRLLIVMLGGAVLVAVSRSARVIEALSESHRLGLASDPDALLEVEHDNGKVTNKATRTRYALRHACESTSTRSPDGWERSSR